MRKALELSMTTAPAFTAAAANSLLRSAPAEKSAISTSLNESFASFRTVMFFPLNSIRSPSERSDASGISSETETPAPEDLDHLFADNTGGTDNSDNVFILFLKQFCP